MLLHYRLVERLGAGGMGIVWRAVDTTLDREVAIKVLPEEVASDPERFARFEREARLLASLAHPNVAAVYGLHEAEGVRFLAMELIRGRSLAQEIALGIPAQRVVELAVSIADGLAAAHRQQVTHRDIKPDNVVLDLDGRPKVLDFGLAKLGPAVPASGHDSPTTTREGSLLGTVAYMSPEQAQGKPVDPRSDVFSLGIVLYEMATGSRPFGGDNAVSTLTAILRDAPARVTERAPAAPAALERIIERCLEKDPERRYGDASAVRDDLRALQQQLVSGLGGRAVEAPRLRGRWITVALAAVLVLAVLGGLAYQRNARGRWVRDTALPELSAIVDRIQVLQEGRESWDAFLLAREIESVAPDDPLLARLRPKFTREITIDSDPPGAEVLVRYYDEPDAAPIVLGRTPLVKIAYPRGFTRVRLELPGKQPVEDVIWNLGIVGDTWSYPLQAPTDVPDEMSFVPAGSFALYLPGLDDLETEATASFLVDRHETTNRDYQRFVDAGGYADPKYWKEAFVDGGRTLTFEEAVSRFVDRTGRPGPATWEVGSYPEGHADDPVAGVSWYEAAAYAEWAGKSLPTIFHWNRVAFTLASSRIVPLANLSAKGIVPAGTTRSTNRFGTVDLAGNVREWAWNENERDAARFILGGGFDDPDYAFADAVAQPPFDRSPSNGFRCVRYVETDTNSSRLHRSIVAQFRDFRAEKPVPEPVFEQYLRQFTYDRTPLNARIEEEDDTQWGRRQKITYDAAYGGERMMAYLFLPLAGKPPFQVVVVFPGSGAITTRSSESFDPGRVDFLSRSGRAVLFPIFKGTYERGGELKSDYPAPTTFYKDYVVMWAKDLGRSIDYVASREDLDAGRIAYYGISWGGALGAILPAIEKRIRVNVLYVAGLCFQRALPEVDAIHYIGRVRQPTLILNGELDFYFPAETSQKPMFDLLGTPSEHKRRLVFPGGHSVPRTEMIRESLQWLDAYLGPVDPAATSR
jgi:dienelactone hydrolase